MNLSPRTAGPRYRQRGQSLTEYVVACAVLAVILFVPITDSASDGESKSTLELILDGFRKAYQKYSYSMSVPELPAP